MPEATIAATPTAPATTDTPVSNLIADAKSPAVEKPLDAATDKPVEKADQPVAYDFKLPEGLTVDETQMTEFKTIAAEAKLSPETAQKLVDLYASQTKAAAEGPYKLWNDTQVQWQENVKADPEIGGKNFDAMKTAISSTIDQVGGKEAQAMRDAFNYTGAGNNPEIIRFVYRLSKAMSEGAPVGGGKPADPGAPKTAGQILYPDQQGLANQHL